MTEKIKDKLFEGQLKYNGPHTHTCTHERSVQSLLPLRSEGQENLMVGTAVIAKI